MPGDGSVLNLRCVTRHQCALKPAEYEQPGRDAEHYPPHSAVLQSDRNLSPIQVDRFSACARASPRVLITLTELTENWVWVSTRVTAQRAAVMEELSTRPWTRHPEETHPDYPRLSLMQRKRKLLCTNNLSLTQCSWSRVHLNMMMEVEAQCKSNQEGKKDGMWVFGETVF